MAAVMAVVFALLWRPLPVAADADGPATYGALGAAAVETLQTRWYDAGRWRMCSLEGCPAHNRDWGADSLTYALALRWRLTHEPALVPYFTKLVATAPLYVGACTDATCRQWSDIPAWDALAALRAYDATGHAPLALEKAKAAYDFVERSTTYATGACPTIRYQQPDGGSNQLKTLETDSNLIRAALLLYAETGEERYRDDAVAQYRAVRRYFLDPVLPLYSVYVFDDGRTCRQLRHRFFASVNGNMIEAGRELAAVTHDDGYLAEAVQTAQAVDRLLADDRGIFANLQAENDVAEPLIEAMDGLAARDGLAFARAWIMRNAAAAAGARTADGSYGRFFDGPAPGGAVTAWQTNGGLALMIAAASLAPDLAPAPVSWRTARLVDADMRTLPATIRFTGSSIALLGTIGEQCCEAGHARIFVDGHETFDRRGIWQNKSCSGGAIHDVVLFAWQWPTSGPHEVRLAEATKNPKEGGSFLHVHGYLVR